MKRGIIYGATAGLMLAGLLVLSCDRSVVIDMAEPQTKADTTQYTPRTRTEDTQEDTTRVPITFDVTITPWPDDLPI